MNIISKNAAIIAATALAVTASVTTVTIASGEDTTNVNAINQVTNAAAVYNNDIVVPTVVVPTVDMPTINTVIADVPKIETMDVTVPKTNKVEVNPVEIEIITAEVPESNKPVIAFPSVDVYKQELDKAIEFRKLQCEYFYDMRNLDHDRSISVESPLWKKWLKVYQNNQNSQIVGAPISYQIRMIAEANAPINSQEKAILEQNLEFYKNAGYNSILLSFNGTESLTDLIDTENLIISKGLKVFIAYSGPEDLEWSMFIDPDKLKEYLSILGTKADGIIIGWRRTALHLFIPDRPYINFILEAATAKNNKLIVLGEAYLGETADSNGTAITINMPRNASGILINGIGFNGVDVKRALDGIFSRVKNQQRIAVIVGSAPYYLTNNSRTFQQNLAIKQNLEKQFLSAGCKGVITLHGDSGRIFYNGRQTSSDSLCHSKAE